MYTSVEQELWRIFTFYSLHGDPNQPEILRPANFVRFCKDCQITSKKITPTSIELEITRLVRINIAMMISFDLFFVYRFGQKRLQVITIHR